MHILKWLVWLCCVIGFFFLSLFFCILHFSANYLIRISKWIGNHESFHYHKILFIFFISAIHNVQIKYWFWVSSLFLFLISIHNFLSVHYSVLQTPLSCRGSSHNDLHTNCLNFFFFSSHHNWKCSKMSRIKKSKQS